MHGKLVECCKEITVTSKGGANKENKSAVGTFYLSNQNGEDVYYKSVNNNKEGQETLFLVTFKQLGWRVSNSIKLMH